MRDGESFIHNWLAAWSSNKPELLRSFYSQNAIYRDPFHRVGISGDQLLPYFSKLLARNPNWVWKAVELFPIENGYCLKWEATIPTATVTLKELGMDIVEVEDGLITRNEVYFDPSRMIEAIQREK